MATTRSTLPQCPSERRASKSDPGLAGAVASGLSRALSLTELKSAVEQLPPPELTELTAFVRQRGEATWDRQIDGDFAGEGRLRAVLEAVRADGRTGRMEELP